MQFVIFGGYSQETAHEIGFYVHEYSQYMNHYQGGGGGGGDVAKTMHLIFLVPTVNNYMWVSV